MNKTILFLTYIVSTSTYAMAENVVSPYADLLIEGGNKNLSKTQILGFVPLHQNANDLIFFDARFMKNFSGKDHKNTKKIYEYNIGPGYRYIIDKNLVIGGATFFDYRNSLINPKKGFKQATINIHALTDTWQGQFNLYLALNSKKIQKQHQSFTGKASIKGDKIALINLNQIQQETNSTGIDINLSRSIPNLEHLRIGSTLYSFKSGIKGAKNIVGFGLDTQYCINDIISFEARASYDKDRQLMTTAGLRFTLDFNKNKSKTALEKLLSTRIKRDVDIVTQTNNYKTYTSQIQNNTRAIKSTTLSNLDDKNNIISNAYDFYSIEEAINNNNILIDVGNKKDGDEFDFNIVDKFEAKDIAQIIIKLKQNHLNQIKNSDQSNFSSNSNLDRVANLIAIQKAYQELNGESVKPLKRRNYRLGDSRISIGFIELQKELFNKYSTSAGSAHTKFLVNLPAYGNVKVERAGLIMLVKNNNESYVLVGTDANSAAANISKNSLPWSAWFSGSCEEKDSDFRETIIREAFEESAGNIALTTQDIDKAIKENRFYYDSITKILTIIEADKNNIYSSDLFNNSIAKLKNNPNIAKSMKEMIYYDKISTTDFDKFAKKMHISNLPNNSHNNIYTVPAIGNKKVRIEHHYAKSLKSLTHNNHKDLQKPDNLFK